MYTLKRQFHSQLAARAESSTQAS